MIGREDMQRTESGMWVDRRKFLKIGGVGLLGTILAACGVGSETTTTAAATTTTAGTGTTLGTTTTVIDKIVANLNKVVMGDFNPNYAAQWSYSLAQALGYLEEYGIEDLERLLTDEYIAGLIGGSIDITHGDTNVFLGSAEASGEPIKIISMYRINEWQILGVRAGIETAEDLIGGTITGGQLEGRNTFVQKKIVTALGLDPETDVQFVPTSGGSDGRLQAVLAGTVDGASLFPRHRFAIEEAGGKVPVRGGRARSPRRIRRHGGLDRGKLRHRAGMGGRRLAGPPIHVRSGQQGPGLPAHDRSRVRDPAGVCRAVPGRAGSDQ